MRAALGLVLLLSALAPAAELAGRPGESQKGTLTSGGRERTFWFHLPARDDGKPRALVIALHGRLGQGKGQEKLGQMSAIADREGFVVVYPDGFKRSWADARGGTPASKEGVDDVRFISDLIDLFVRAARVDPARVYATGMSNGAEMSHTLGCKLASRIAAIAPVAGNLPAALSACRPERPVPVLMALGTEDPLMPYQGGAVHGGASGAVLSAADSLSAWAKADGCGELGPDEALPDTDPSDQTTVTRRAARGCPSGVSVTLLTIHGGGHTWPGGLQYLPARFIGRTTRDFQADEAIWAFFKPIVNPPR